MVQEIINQLKTAKTNIANISIDKFYSLAILPDNKFEIFEIQEFLVDEICKIHKHEITDINTNIFKANISFKDNYDKFIHGSRGCNMYVFNRKDYEYYIIGDIHSDSISLKQILDKTNFFSWNRKDEKKSLIFLGDYIDRGGAHLKNLHHILLLKYLFPNQIYLLRGNHDGATINDGEVKLCVGKPNEDPEDDYFFLYINKHMKKLNEKTPHIAEVYIRLFNSMCTLAFIHSNSTNFLLTHGGIPRPDKNQKDCYHFINTISDLTNESIVDKLNGSIIHNMLWSDPCDNGDDLRENTRRFGFTEDDFLKFKDKIGFDFLIRGHEAENDGYKYFYNGQVITIFSTGKIIENAKNINLETAYSFVSPKIIKICNGSMELKGL